MKNNEFRRQDVNECTSRGICSLPSSLAALQEILLFLFSQISYYILLLNDIGGTNEQVKDSIITDISSLVFINEFSDEQLFDIVLRNYYLLTDVKKICEENYINFNKPISIPNFNIDFSSSTTLNSAISIGEKLNNKNLKEIPFFKKNLFEVMTAVIKSVCMSLSMLKDYSKIDRSSYTSVLKALNSLNNPSLSSVQIKDYLANLAQIDEQVKLNLSQNLFKNFGEISKAKVSRSTRFGKAILVSGNNLKTLKKILDITEKENIDIYTHSNLIVAHSFPLFRQYRNLLGHYGGGEYSALLDFATFPGSILLTKSSKNSTEFLYRGKIYSDDYITHKGVKKIENADYHELIESAKSAKGFKKGKEKGHVCVGYDVVHINNILDCIINKLKNSEIKRLFIIGANPHSEIQKEYFKEFFKNLKSNEYIISFSYESQKKNILTLNIGNFFPLITSLLEKLRNSDDITDDRIIFMFTMCEVYNISEIINLRRLGAKNIYMSDCTPNAFKPIVFNTFIKEYDINLLSEPLLDLHEIRHKKSTS